MQNKYKLALIYSGASILGVLLFLIQYNRIDPFLLFLYELLLVFGYIATVIDIKEKRIPNKLILTMIGVWVISIVAKIFFDIEVAVILLIDSLIGFAIGGGLFFIVYLVSRKGLGGGDVKFMAAAGLYLGFTKLLSAMLYGTLLAAIVAVTLLLIKKIGRKDSIPLAPFLFLGILVAVIFG